MLNLATGCAALSAAFGPTSTTQPSPLPRPGLPKPFGHTPNRHNNYARLGFVQPNPLRTGISPTRQRLTRLQAIHEMPMPSLSSTMTEGKVAQWLANEGDQISAGDAIVVIESDKADMDVEAYEDGFIAKILVGAGESVPVGEPIALIADSKEEIETAQATSGSKLGAPKSEGADSETTSKASENSKQSPTPEAAPTPSAQASTATEAETKPAQPVKESESTKTSAPVDQNGDRIVASALARKRANDFGIDLSKLEGTGKGGRIIAPDVIHARQQGTADLTASSPQADAPTENSPAVKAPAATIADTTPPKANTAGSALAPSSNNINGIEYDLHPMSGLEKAVANNMLTSLSVPTFYVTKDITTDNLDQLYKTLKPHKVSKTVLLAKAVALTLKKLPIINACYQEDAKGQGQFAQPKNINVAIAVAMPDGGLITPVLKDADQKDIYSLNRDWGDLVNRAREKKLSPDEYNSGTFTISNMGSFGVNSFTSILPPNQGSILAVASSQTKMVDGDNGLPGLANQASCTITCDHRVIYGAQAAEFMGLLNDQLKPERINELLM